MNTATKTRIADGNPHLACNKLYKLYQMRTLHLLACQARVTVGLCCCVPVMSFELCFLLVFLGQSVEKKPSRDLIVEVLNILNRGGKIHFDQKFNICLCTSDEFTFPFKTDR